MSITITSQDWRKGAEQEYLDRRQREQKRRDVEVRLLERLESRIARRDETIAELDRAALTFGIQPPAPVREPSRQNVKPVASAAPQFKDVALDYLKEAHPKTLKAAQIQNRCEILLGRKFHEKTAGMTLYRLAKDGLVRRIGRAHWLYVPQTDDKGPEVDAAGPSLFSDRRGD